MSKFLSIKYLNQIGNLLKGFRNHFPAFELIFEKEEQAVIEHNIRKLEEVCYEKQSRCKTLEADIHGLIILANNFSQSCIHSHDLFSASHPESLSDLRKLIEGYQSQVESETDGSSQQAVLAGQTILLLHQLVKAFQELRPKIEKNRYIINRLLAHHQQSYQFWSELHQEVSSNYDQKGSKKSHKTLSQIFAKA